MNFLTRHRAQLIASFVGEMFVVLAFLLLGGCGLFPESSFDLAPDSPLPRWFVLPTGLTRSQASVRLDYYNMPWGRRATFKLFGPSHELLSKVTGTQDGDEPKLLRVQPPGYPAGYPAYEVISVNGITDIIEHRKMEPIFYVSENPTVWAELIPTKARRP